MAWALLQRHQWIPGPPGFGGGTLILLWQVVDLLPVLETAYWRFD